MAHEGIFATSDEIIKRAGKDYNSVDITEAVINDFASQSESIINSRCRYNFSDQYASLNADVKRLLSSCSAAWCAMMMASYDQSSYPSRVHAENTITVQRDNFLMTLAILKDKKIQTYMIGA